MSLEMRSRETPASPVVIFVSYAGADAPYVRALQSHLAEEVRVGRITLVVDRQAMLPGVEVEPWIDARLREADIALFLLSRDFLASEWCLPKELPRALARRDDGLHLVPVRLRPCEIPAPLAELNALPSPRTWLEDPADDRAWAEVVRGVLSLAESIRRARAVGRRRRGPWGLAFALGAIGAVVLSLPWGSPRDPSLPWGAPRDPPPEIPVRVVLFDARDGVPAAGPPLLAFLGERLVPALVAGGARAIVLDVDAVGAVDEALSVPASFVEALSLARRAGVEVYAVERPAARLAAPVCGEGEASSCLAGRLAWGPPRPMGATEESWPACVGGRPTAGHLLALLVVGAPTAAVPCPRTGIPLLGMAEDVCGRAWDRRWVSELLGLAPGTDPLRGGPAVACPERAGAGTSLVVVGDPRATPAGQDAFVLGGQLVAGAEAHALAAWSAGDLR